MTAEESYIAQVVARLPRVPALQTQVAMEVRSHIAERVEHGDSVTDALHRLGDPIELADSYLAAVPLVAATFGQRAKARVLDVLVFLGVCGPVIGAIALTTQSEFLVLGVIVFVLIGAPFYFVVAEYRFGKTVGKHLVHLRVVRESGGRISFGQAIVRQLPAVTQIFWIDILFALFTEKSQRAFEILSKTRVVAALEEESCSNTH